MFYFFPLFVDPVNLSFNDSIINPIVFIIIVPLGKEKQNVELF